MPETGTPPADGTTGAEGTKTPAATPDPKVGEQNPETGKTFTQADVDRIVADRVARAKPDDYDEAKAALGREKAREEGEKTDLQKANETLTERTAERDSARDALKQASRITELRLEALRQGADEEIVIALLKDSKAVTVSDGQVVGAKEAVSNLIDQKPNVKTGGTRTTAGEFGGNDGKTVTDQIATLESSGKPEDRQKAFALKVAQGLALPRPG